MISSGAVVIDQANAGFPGAKRRATLTLFVKENQPRRMLRHPQPQAFLAVFVSKAQSRSILGHSQPEPLCPLFVTEHEILRLAGLGLFLSTHEHRGSAKQKGCSEGAFHIAVLSFHFVQTL